jgi:DNA repair photolyase
MQSKPERTLRLPQLPLRGRGTSINPRNRFESASIAVDELYLDHMLREHSEAADAGVDCDAGSVPSRLAPPSVPAPGAQQLATQVLEDDTESVLNHVDAPDLHFRWTLNPYRGCEHGCVYCYARPGHEYLGLSCGVDFESRIFAKPRAPELLRRELARPSWEGEPIMLSGVTDCYQPVERELGITRRCLEVMLELRQPVSVITKSKLILRDLDILREMARLNLVHAAISLTTLDAKLAMAMEPRASSPRSRLDAIRTLADAGVPVMVMTAPIIPGLNDAEIPALLREASRAGARSAGYVLLRLPHQVKGLFLEWLARTVPGKAARIEALVRDTRSGELYDARWGARGWGTGPVADHVRATFEVFRRRYRLDERPPPHDRTLFRKPRREDAVGQLGLFEPVPSKSQSDFDGTRSAITPPPSSSFSAARGGSVARSGGPRRGWPARVSAPRCPAPGGSARPAAARRRVLPSSRG